MWETSGRGGAAGVLGEEERRSGPIRYSRYGNVMNDLGETSRVLSPYPALTPAPTGEQRAFSLNMLRNLSRRHRGDSSGRAERSRVPGGQGRLRRLGVPAGGRPDPARAVRRDGPRLLPHPP